MKAPIWLLALFIAVTGNAQQSKPLSVGSVCPDLSFKTVFNTGRSEAKLSDYRNRNIILLFSGVGCPAVIAEFPAWQQLQAQFKNDLQLIVFNSNTPAGWQKLAGRNAAAKALSLPLVLADTALAALFPHRETPHVVWLNRERRVMAITSEQYLSAANLQSFLKGEPNNWRVKKDNGPHDFTRPLVQPVGETRPEGPVYFSVLTGHKEGTPREKKVITDSNTALQRVTWINVSLLDLVMESMVVPGGKKFRNNRILWEDIDSTRFVYNPAKGYRDQWQRQNTWCYEIRLPLNTPAAVVKQAIRTDLLRFLGMEVTEEKRKVPCYSLFRLESTAGNPTAKNEKKPVYRTMIHLLEVLNLAHPFPVVDESGISGEIGIPNMGPAVWNISSVKELLAPYGIGIKQVERELDMVVVRQNKREQ